VALYRQHRPSSFEDVIGQEAVVRALRAALSKGAVGHAVLLQGPRGTGKTTLARLLARGLTCGSGPTDEPCGTCRSCVALDAESSLDVVEMDAASHRGVDDVRAVNERLAIAPVEGHSRVFILDEAHMLTAAAQNALLKMLEEPPDNTYFILCTTAGDKLLDTVRSRCHRYSLSSATTADLVKALRRVCDSEGLATQDGALEAVAAGARGSYRDALSILEPAAIDGTVDVETIQSLMGRPPSALVAAVLDAMASQNPETVLRATGGIVDGGYSVDVIVTTLCDALRLALHAAVLGSVPAQLAFDPIASAAATRVAETLGAAAVLQALQAIDIARSQATSGVPFDTALEGALVGLFVTFGAPAKSSLAPVAPVQVEAAQISAPVSPPAEPSAAVPEEEPATAGSGPSGPRDVGSIGSDANEDNATVAPDEIRDVATIVPEESSDALAPPPTEIPTADQSDDAPFVDGDDGGEIALKATGYSLRPAQVALAFPLLKLVLRHIDQSAYLALRTARTEPKKGAVVVRCDHQLTERQKGVLRKVLDAFGYDGNVEYESLSVSRKVPAAGTSTAAPQVSDNDLAAVLSSAGLKRAE
jgi:DNA polymerase-3 subunit gamma/tau